MYKRGCQDKSYFACLFFILKRWLRISVIGSALFGCTYPPIILVDPTPQFVCPGETLSVDYYFVNIDGIQVRTSEVPLDWFYQSWGSPKAGNFRVSKMESNKIPIVVRGKLGDTFPVSQSINPVVIDSPLWSGPLKSTRPDLEERIFHTFSVQGEDRKVVTVNVPGDPNYCSAKCDSTNCELSCLEGDDRCRERCRLDRLDCSRRCLQGREIYTREYKYTDKVKAVITQTNNGFVWDLSGNKMFSNHAVATVVKNDSNNIIYLSGPEFYERRLEPNEEVNLNLVRPHGIWRARLDEPETVIVGYVDPENNNKIVLLWRPRSRLQFHLTCDL